MVTIKRFARYGLLLIACGLVAAVIRYADLISLASGDEEAFERLMENSVGVFLLLTLTLMIVQNLLTVIPVIALIVLNVAVLGYWNGLLWSWVSSIIGSTAAFLASRYWFQDLFRKQVKQAVQEKIERNGFWYILGGRLIPVLPSCVINIAGGLSSIRLRHFLYATMIGNLAYFSVVVLAQLGIMSLNGWEDWLLVAMVALLAAGVAFWRRRNRKTRISENNEGPTG